MTRTDQQRKAIEVLCNAYAEALNFAGYDMPTVLAKKVIPVSWSQEAVKEYLFKAIALAMFQVTSTTQLETIQVSEVYRQLDKWMDSEFGISIEFPSEDRRQAS